MYLDLSGAPDALAYLLVDVFYRALRTLPRTSGWSSRAAIESVRLAALEFGAEIDEQPETRPHTVPMQFAS